MCSANGAASEHEIQGGFKLEKSQEEFALMIGMSVATLQNWEQGRRRPEGPARALLRVAAKNPQAVAKALAT